MSASFTKVDYDTSVIIKVINKLNDFKENRSTLENKIIEMLDLISSEQCSFATIKQVNEAKEKLVGIIKVRYGPTNYDISMAVSDFTENFEIYTRQLDSILDAKSEVLFDFEYTNKFSKFRTYCTTKKTQVEEIVNELKIMVEACNKWVNKFNNYTTITYKREEFDGAMGAYEQDYKDIQDNNRRIKFLTGEINDIIKVIDKLDYKWEILNTKIGETEDEIIAAYDLCKTEMDSILEKLEYSVDMHQLSLLANKSVTEGKYTIERNRVIETTLKNVSDFVVLLVDIVSVVAPFAFPGAGVVITVIGVVVNALIGSAWGVYYANTGRPEKAIIEFAGALPVDKIANLGKWGIKIINKALDGLDHVVNFFKKIDEDVAEKFVKIATTRNRDSLIKANKALDFVISNGAWLEVGKSLGLALADGQLSQTEKASLMNKVIATSKSKEEILAVINEYKKDPVLYNNLFELMVKIS